MAKALPNSFQATDNVQTSQGSFEAAVNQSGHLSTQKLLDRAN